MSDLHATTEAPQEATPIPEAMSVREAARWLTKNGAPEPEVHTVELPDIPNRTEKDADGNERNLGIKISDGARALSDSRSKREERARELDALLKVGADDEAGEPEQPATKIEQPDAAEIAKQVSKQIADEERERTTRARHQFHNDLAQTFQAQRAQLLAEVPELGLPDAAKFEELAQTDPQRYQRARATIEGLKELRGTMQREGYAAVVDQEQQFANWAKEQDTLAEAKLPAEMKSNPKFRADFNQATLAMLKAEGITEDELVKSWGGRAHFSMRDARVQSIIGKAALYDMMQAKASEVRAKPLPPVQRPGVSRGPGAAAREAATGAVARFNQAPTVRNAVAALRARRAAS